MPAASAARIVGARFLAKLLMIRSRLRKVPGKMLDAIHEHNDCMKAKRAL